MIVKQIGNDWIMPLSYWDGGYVRLNVNDPANPMFIHQTDYPAVDPELADPTNDKVPIPEPFVRSTLAVRGEHAVDFMTRGLAAARNED